VVGGSEHGHDLCDPAAVGLPEPGAGRARGPGEVLKVQEQATQTPRSAAPARILVVDDTPDIQELLRIHLEAAGYQVLVAGNGQEALAAVTAEAPDLILLDVLMPVMDGYEVCRRLKADGETAFIPIVILTALQDLSHRLRGIELGADDFLTKPFNHLELLTRVRSLLRVKGLHDQVVATNRFLERRVAERTAALEQALADLTEMDRLKSEFLSNISHELRSPLTPIKGYLPGLLREELGPLTSSQRRALGHIAESVDRLHRLIDDLLTFMEWESGEISLALGGACVAKVVEEALAWAASGAQGKGVEVATEIGPDLPQIRADTASLARALGHLVENAVKFTPQGGHVTVTARLVQPSPLPPGPPAPRQFVELAVQDTGVGIPPEVIPKIFECFYQADSSSTRQHGGTGLGLAIVKRILDAHKAPIAVESLPGQGTIFSIRIPIAA
jgi:signal transduction histidine kinase